MGRRPVLRCMTFGRSAPQGQGPDGPAPRRAREPPRPGRSRWGCGGRRHACRYAPAPGRASRRPRIGADGAGGLEAVRAARGRAEGEGGGGGRPGAGRPAPPNLPRAGALRAAACAPSAPHRAGPSGLEPRRRLIVEDSAPPPPIEGQGGAVGRPAGGGTGRPPRPCLYYTVIRWLEGQWSYRVRL